MSLSEARCIPLEVETHINAQMALSQMYRFFKLGAANGGLRRQSPDGIVADHVTVELVPSVSEVVIELLQLKK
jgi:hypothetical protein